MMRLLTFSMLVCFAVVARADQPDQSDVTVLFNGKDLTGWQGRADLWSVEDGAIVGRTTAEKPLKVLIDGHDWCDVN